MVSPHSELVELRTMGGYQASSFDILSQPKYQDEACDRLRMRQRPSPVFACPENGLKGRVQALIVSFGRRAADDDVVVGTLKGVFALNDLFLPAVGIFDFYFIVAAFRGYDPGAVAQRRQKFRQVCRAHRAAMIFAAGAIIVIVEGGIASPLPLLALSLELSPGLLLLGLSPGLLSPELSAGLLSPGLLS